MLKYIYFLSTFVLLVLSLSGCDDEDQNLPIIVIGGEEMIAGMDNPNACSMACQSLLTCDGFMGCSNVALDIALSQCLTDCQANNEELISLSQLICDLSEPQLKMRYDLEECRQDSDLCAGQVCGPGFVCDPSDGMCVDPCIGVICAVGIECVDGACQDPCADIECPEGLGCFAGSCTDLCFGVSCDDNQMCDTDTGMCINQCGDVTCSRGTRCEGGLCIPACQDIECPDDLSCDANTGACINRCDNVTCAEGFTCNPRSGFCRDSCEGVSCVEGWICDQGLCTFDDPCTDITCNNGRLCSPEMGRCELFFCGPDRFESGNANNNLPQATQLRSETQRIDDLTICSIDFDWYTFTLPAHQSARVSIRFENHVADLTLRMYTSNNLLTPTLEINSQNDDEFIGLIPNDEDRRFYFRVSATDSFQQNRYSLVIELDLPGTVCNDVSECGDARECTRALCDGLGDTDPSTDVIGVNDPMDPTDPMDPECMEDSFEPNDTYEDATEFTTFNTESLSAQICGNNTDFYLINLEETSDLEILVNFTHSEGDLDISLVEANGESLALGVSSNDNERIFVESLPANSYYLIVYGFAGSENSYSISVNQSPSAGEMNECVIDDECRWDYACLSGNCSIPETYCDDEASPNSAYAQAYRVMIPSRFDNLTFCDTDYFSVNLTEGQEVTMRVRFSNDEGQDIDVRFYRPDGTVAQVSSGIDDVEEITFIADMAGIYTLEVYGYFGFSESLPFITRYTLDIE